MTTTLTLVGDVFTAHGALVIAASGDLEATGSNALTPQLAVFSTIAGILTPFAVAFVNRPTFPPLTRALVTILMSLGIGALVAIGEGQLTELRLSVAALTVLGVAVATYQRLFAQPAQRFELATTPKHARQ